MQKLAEILPSDLNEIDPDDLYDQLEEWLTIFVNDLPQKHFPAPSISDDDLLDSSALVIELQDTFKQLKRGFAFLEDEDMDTGLLEMRLQPIEDKVQGIHKALKTSNQMIYCFDHIKRVRKRAKRFTRHAKRIQNQSELSALETQTNELTDNQNFASQIEAYDSQGLNTDGLYQAFERMEKQFEKMQEAFDSSLERLS